MKQLMKSALGPFFFRFHNRSIGKKMEIGFWSKWFKKNGWHWKDSFQRRLSVDSEVIGHHREILERYFRPGMTILDVGAGPITGIYACFKGERLNIRACDPLGDDYRDIMKREGIVPRVVTETVHGEKIASYYKEKFDWVNCENALDHAEMPAVIIDQMIDLVNDSGVISLYHEINEGLREGYRGFHKWNIAPVENSADAFTISNPHARYEFMSGYRGLAVNVESRGQHVYCILRKSPAK